MSITLESISSLFTPQVLQALTDWEKNYGNGNQELEALDFFCPYHSYNENTTSVSFLITEWSKYMPQPSTLPFERRFFQMVDGAIYSQTSQHIGEKLGGAVVEGSSSYMNVQAFTVMALEDPSGKLSTPARQAVPFLVLGFFGVTPDEVGVRGYTKDKPGDVAGFIEGKKGPLALMQGMVVNPLIERNPDSRFQVEYAPAMLLHHVQYTPEELRQMGEPGVFMYGGYVGKNESIQGRAVSHLQQASEEGPKIALNGLGENELLTFDGYKIEPDQFRKDVTEHLSALSQAVDGTLVFRSGIVPAYLMYEKIPEDVEVTLVSKNKILSVRRVKLEGAMAFKPIVDQIKLGGVVFEEDVLTREEFSKFVDYIHELQNIEKEVCAELGVSLVSFDETQFATILGDQKNLFFWEDGVHARQTLSSLVALRTALEMSSELEINPTDEVLSVMQETLGLTPKDLGVIFSQKDPQVAIDLILERLKTLHPEPKETDPKAWEKAAVLFSLLFNTSGRTRKMAELLFFLNAYAELAFSQELEMEPGSGLAGGLMMQSAFVPVVGLPFNRGMLMVNSNNELRFATNVLDPDLKVELSFGTNFVTSRGLVLGKAELISGYDFSENEYSGESRLALGLGFDPALLGPRAGIGGGIYVATGMRGWVYDPLEKTGDIRITPLPLALKAEVTFRK